jgi:hypothetical protein
MRYILDDSGYIYSVSCNPIECNNKGCTGYTGAVPEGYDSLEHWATTANIRAYKIVSGNLTYDSTRAAALEEEWSLTNGRGVLLWTNPDPTASIAYTYDAITLSSNDFDELEFWFYRNTDKDVMLSSKTKKGFGVVATYTNGYTGVSYSRFLTKGSSNTKYTVNECYRCGTGITPPSASNSELIPAFIVGYKNK